MALDTIFDRVLQDFKNEISEEQRKEFDGTTLENLRVTAAAIQEKQRKTRTAKNLTRLKGFLEAMETFSKVFDVVSNSQQILAFIWGPIKYLLLVTSTFAGAYDALLDAYQRIAENLPILDQYQSLFGTDLRMQRVLEATFRNIFEFHQQALDYFRGNIWKQLFPATWKTFNTRFGSILNNLKHHKDLAANQATLGEFEEARNARILHQKNFTAHEEQEMLRRKTYLLGWLSAANSESDQEDGESARQGNPESGRWILSRDKFRTWYDPQTVSAPLLWISGMPGAGKSVLASLIVNEASKLPDTTVLYFYCRHGDPRRNSFVAMARKFLHQIMLKNESLMTWLYEEAILSGESTTLNTRKVAERLLETCLKALGKIYIILDGLDECPEWEQKNIAIWLRKFVDASINNPDPSRCVFLSQDDGAVRSLFSKLPTLKISPSDNRADIEAYCRDGAKRIQSKFSIDDGETHGIASTTAKLAKGMFLFAKLVMDNLYKQPRLVLLRKEMRSDIFPAGLDAAYSRILARIFNEEREFSHVDTLRLLAWIVCAKRPLKWREIQTAVSIDTANQTLDIEEGKFIEGAKDLCGSLVEEDRNGEITFVHTTAKFYMIRAGHVQPDGENLKLGQLCVEYLSLPIFDRDISDEGLSESIEKGSYGFLDYAAVNWATHLEAGLQAATSHPLLAGFEESIDGFFALHWQKPDKKAKVPRAVIRCLKVIERFGLRCKLMDTMASLHALQLAEASSFESLATLDIFQTVYRIRKRTEQLATSPQNIDALHHYYGPQVFKCNRLACMWFYEGFHTRADRDAHQTKHERSFYCSFSGCPVTTLGCTNQRDLESHIATYHNDEFLPIEDVERERSASSINALSEGPDVAGMTSKRRRQESPGTGRELELDLDTPLLRPASAPAGENGRYQCHVCSRRFALMEDLRSHRQTHSDESMLTKIFEQYSSSKRLRLTKAPSDG